jgi:hypothetical protein
MMAGQVSSAIRRAGVAALGVAAIGFVSGAGSAAAQTAKPAADCQPYQKNPCPLVFPDNRFTKPDKSSATGLRVHLKQKNAASAARWRGIRCRSIVLTPFGRDFCEVVLPAGEPGAAPEDGA